MWTRVRVLVVTSGLDALFDGKNKTLTVPQVADLLGMTKQGVYNWLRAGVIPGYKVGSSWFILRDELKATFRVGANPGPHPDLRPVDGTTNDAREDPS